MRPPGEPEAQQYATVGTLHPVIRAHPEIGRKGRFMQRLQIEGTRPV